MKKMPTADKNYLYIFSTSEADESYYGNMASEQTKTSGLDAKSIDNADSNCRNAGRKLANKGIIGSYTEYKALIVNDDTNGKFRKNCINNGSNVVCNFNNATNWPLGQSVSYWNTSRDFVTSTDIDGVFSSKLESSITPKPEQVWTGMNQDWTPNAYNCHGWKAHWDMTLYQGAIGDPSSTNLATFSNSAYASCNSRYALICVQAINGAPNT